MFWKAPAHPPSRSDMTIPARPTSIAVTSATKAPHAWRTTWPPRFANWPSAAATYRKELHDEAVTLCDLFPARLPDRYPVPLRPLPDVAADRAVHLHGLLRPNPANWGFREGRCSVIIRGEPSPVRGRLPMP